MDNLLKYILAKREMPNGFLNASDLLDPTKISGVERAVRRISSAIRTRERIHICGDYDVDGMTSTILMQRGLERLGADVTYSIPKRKDGYGISYEAIRQSECSLLITVDVGISESEKIDGIQKSGVDVIIVDHHSNPEQIPQAHTIVNQGNTYQTPYSAAGLAYALLRGLYDFSSASGLEADLINDIDLAGIGTMADAVPLIGENRVLAKRAIQQMRATPREGIDKMLGVLGINKPVNSRDIIWRIVPCLNAPSRILDTVDLSIRLLTTQDYVTASITANEIDRINRARRDIVESHMASVDTNEKMPIIIGDFLPGVIGLIASRASKGKVGAVALCDDGNGLYKASFRGNHSFEILSRAGDVYESFGGHPGAGGFSIKRENLDKWMSSVKTIAEEFTYERSDPYEFVVPASMLTDKSVEALAALEPFGAGNPPPVFKVDGEVKIVREFHKRNGEGCYELSVGKTHAVWWGANGRDLPKSVVLKYDSRNGLTLDEEGSVDLEVVAEGLAI